MSEENVDLHEVDEQSYATNDPDVILEEQDDETRGEWAKFGILAVVLLFTVLIIALLRPYIFKTIIPAVLGEGQPTAPVMDDTNAETIKPATDEAEESEAGEESESASDAVESEEENAPDTAVSPTDTSEEATEPEKPEDFPTAVPTQSHTVQAGENLTTIAQRYGVTVQAIVAANNIANPDRVAVGTVLIIPEAGN